MKMTMTTPTLNCIQQQRQQRAPSLTAHNGQPSINGDQQFHLKSTLAAAERIWTGDDWKEAKAFFLLPCYLDNIYRIG